jgi:foldase protein PrsA
VRVVSSRRRSCIVLTLGALLLAAVGLTACGDGIADNIAVRVRDRSIARATVTHWMSVIAGEVSTGPNQPEPQVPDPPRYSACIAYRRSFPTTSVTGRAKPTSVELKHECGFEFQKEKLKALYFLISCDWVIGEAAEVGVTLTHKDVVAQLVLLERQAPNAALFRRFIVGARGTVPDMLLRIQLNLLTMRIQAKLESEARRTQPTVPQRQRALDTSCRPGYVVPICKQYKVPKVPPSLVSPRIPLTDMTAE